MVPCGFHGYRMRARVSDRWVRFAPPPPCPRRRPRAAGRSGTAGTATRAQSLPEPAPVCQPNGQRGQSAHRCHLEPRPLFASAVQSRFWALFPWQRLMAKLLKNEKVRRVLYLSAIYSPHPAPNFRLHSPHTLQQNTHVGKEIKKFIFSDIAIFQPHFYLFYSFFLLFENFSLNFFFSEGSRSLKLWSQGM